MKNNNNNTAEERNYNFIQRAAGVPEIDNRIDETNEELKKVKRNGAIAIVATAAVGAVSTITTAFVLKKKLTPTYMTLPQIINLGKYAEYKELISDLNTKLNTESIKKTAAEAEGADEAAKTAYTEAVKARKEAENKLDEFMRVDDDKKEKKEKKNKKKNENKSKGKG
jgi:hypothetical protein